MYTKTMKIFRVFLAGMLIFSYIGISYCGEVDDDDRSSGSGNQALTGAIMGGLLGGGLGAAIGSASGHAGTGAAIGAGVGAVGGTLIGANKASKDASEAIPVEEKAIPKGAKIKKKVIREYDEKGNVISEKEVKL